MVLKVQGESRVKNLFCGTDGIFQLFLPLKGKKLIVAQGKLYGPAAEPLLPEPFGNAFAQHIQSDFHFLFCYNIPGRCGTVADGFDKGLSLIHI